MTTDVAQSRIQIGNTKQHGYAIGLLRRLPEADLQGICTQVLGDIPESRELTVHAASQVIGHLQQLLGVSSQDKRSRSSDSKKTTATLSAHELRQIATGQTPRPHSLDGSSEWVLEMLSRVLAVKEIITADESGHGRNRGGPIQMTELVEYFGGWDGLAIAFEVTVSTAKAWGETLPSARQYEAEVKTNRTFRAQP